MPRPLTTISAVCGTQAQTAQQDLACELLHLHAALRTYHMTHATDVMGPSDADNERATSQHRVLAGATCRGWEPIPDLNTL